MSFIMPLCTYPVWKSATVSYTKRLSIDLPLLSFAPLHFYSIDYYYFVAFAKQKKNIEREKSVHILYSHQNYFVDSIVHHIVHLICNTLIVFVIFFSCAVAFIPSLFSFIATERAMSKKICINPCLARKSNYIDFLHYPCSKAYPTKSVIF